MNVSTDIPNQRLSTNLYIQLVKSHLRVTCIYFLSMMEEGKEISFSVPDILNISPYPRNPCPHSLCLQNSKAKSIVSTLVNAFPFSPA